ncbi:putative Syntaxin/SNARE domain containing protein, partial [Leishmania shawi]
QSKEVLASIIETRNDIYRIEQSMRELNQLFNDLALLVNEQGEIMDVILANVQRSIRYVEKGSAELKKGRKYQKKSRKKLICFVVCIGIIVALSPPLISGWVTQGGRGTSSALDFYRDTAVVLGSLKAIRTAMEELRQKHAENMQTVDETRSKALRLEIDELSREASNAARAAKDKLDAMSRNTANLKKTPDSVHAC